MLSGAGEASISSSSGALPSVGSEPESSSAQGGELDTLARDECKYPQGYPPGCTELDEELHASVAC